MTSLPPRSTTGLRARALSLAVMTLPYYWRTMPVLCTSSLAMAQAAVLDSPRRRRWTRAARRNVSLEPGHRPGSWGLLSPGYVGSCEERCRGRRELVRVVEPGSVCRARLHDELGVGGNRRANSAARVGGVFRSSSPASSKVCGAKLVSAARVASGSKAPSEPKTAAASWFCWLTAAAWWAWAAASHRP